MERGQSVSQWGDYLRAGYCAISAWHVNLHRCINHARRCQQSEVWKCSMTTLKNDGELNHKEPEWERVEEETEGTFFGSFFIVRSVTERNRDDPAVIVQQHIHVFPMFSCFRWTKNRSNMTEIYSKTEFRTKKVRRFINVKIMFKEPKFLTST